MKKNLLLSGVILLGCSAVAFAGPGDGIKVGGVVVNPFVDGSATYDSNVGLARRSESAQVGIDSASEESDTFFEVRYGLNLDLSSDRIKLGGSVFGFNTMYQDFDELDHDGFGENLSLTIGSRDAVELKLSESYQVVQDVARAGSANASEVNTLGLGVDRADRLKRDQFEAAAQLAMPLSEKLELDIGVGYNMIDYDDAALFDRDGVTVGGDLGFVLSEKTTLFLHGDYGMEDSDALNDDGTQTAARVGFRSRGTDKLTYTASAGYVMYESELAEGNEDIDEGGLSFNLGATLELSPKLSLNASAGNSYAASSFTANNAREIISGQVGLTHRTSEALTLGAAYSYRNDDYVFPIAVNEEAASEDRTSQAVSVSANYAPPGKWYVLHADVAYESSDSEFQQEDYDQFRGTVGASVYY